MDFVVDYQTYAMADAATSELPEPEPRLNLTSDAQSQPAGKVGLQFKLPDLEHHANNHTNLAIENDGAGSKDLHKRMTHYAMSSIEKIQLSNPNKHLGQNSPNDKLPQQEAQNFTNYESNNLDLSKLVSTSNGSNKNTTNLVLSNKLSKILNNYTLINYQATIQLRKSLKILEENKERLSLDEQKLMNPDYVGTLARRALRTDLESQLLKEHITVLEEFKPIIRRIKRFSSSVEKIQKTSENLLSNETDKVPKNNVALQEINQYRLKADQLKLKKKILISIRDRFTLNQIEDDVITNGTIDKTFFDVVRKVIAIKDESSFLLTLPNLNAGNALIVGVNEILQKTNKKIFNYLIDFLYSFESSSNLLNDHGTTEQENLTIFRKSLVFLSSDLELFNELLKRVTTLRSKSILDEFLSQFDMNSATSKPIILSAHDPIRYIGDVLASVHSIIANEADFVKSLFNFQDEDLKDTPLSILQQNGTFLNGIDNKLLNDIIQSLSNSCRIRIEQIVRFEENPIINFEIVRLLKLYRVMFERKGIQDDSSIINNLQSLEDISKHRIIGYYEDYIKQTVPTETANSSDDLLPPEWLSEYINKLVELFEIYEKTHAAEDEESEDNKLLSYKNLQTIVEQPIKGILMKQLLASFPLAKKNEKVKASLLTIEINCLDLIKSRLQPFEGIFAQDDDSREITNWVYDKLNEFTKQMQTLQIKFLFENTGLDLYNNLVNMIFPVDSVKDELDYDMYLALRDNSLMELDTIRKNVHDKLNDYLPQALTDVQGNLLFKLTSPTIADEICDECFKKLSLFYNIFRKVLVHLHPNKKDQVFEILNFSTDEFDMLVGIDH
ncbi:Golgi transport complex subunit COG6 [Saccharomyces paradoxus]|uniref:Conserved oligomeric Golgi complex subunit 6 n=1 Tax=Saccharomyces paradoxus TaxID=27291 RepID=A0A8B8UYQ2_SACPA|nr:Cog6 [Saccharomyces paradoxus]QHS75863.1 Cog6 [Saccharomyces paradoxus]